MGRKKKKTKPPYLSETVNARHLSLNEKDLPVNNEDPPKESNPGKVGKKKAGSSKMNDIYESKSSLNKPIESHVDISIYKDILQRPQNTPKRTFCEIEDIGEDLENDTPKSVYEGIETNCHELQSFYFDIATQINEPGVNKF